VVLTADGQRAVSASGDNTLKVWDIESGQELRTLSGHSDPVNAVVVTADGRRAVSASADHTLKVWDLEKATILAGFTCDDSARCCAFVGPDKIRRRRGRPALLS
jgi:WD40 repeat protein